MTENPQRSFDEEVAYLMWLDPAMSKGEAESLASTRLYVAKPEDVRLGVLAERERREQMTNKIDPKTGKTWWEDLPRNPEPKV